MKLVPGYRRLKQVLDRAYEQSAYGKGRERHANDKPFEKQPIMQITESVGIGFPLGQASKKITESAGMIERGQSGAAVHELLGAIVYLCAAIIKLENEIDQRKL